MNSKRLMVELILALALAWFALTVGEAYAEDAGCGRGLPALSAEPGTQDTGSGIPIPGASCTPGSSLVEDKGKV